MSANTNTSNYMEQGGDKWVIGGELEINGALTINDGATVTGVVSAEIVNNLTTTTGGKALDARQGKALKALIDAIDGVGEDNVGDGLAFDSGVISVSVGEGLEIDGDGAVAAVVGDGLEIGEDNEIKVTAAANVAASTQETSPTVAEFNALLAALKAAKLMEPDGD